MKRPMLSINRGGYLVFLALVLAADAFVSPLCGRYSLCGVACLCDKDNSSCKGFGSVSSRFSRSLRKPHVAGRRCWAMQAGAAVTRAPDDLEDARGGHGGQGSHGQKAEGGCNNTCTATHSNNTRHIRWFRRCTGVCTHARTYTHTHTH